VRKEVEVDKTAARRETMFNAPGFVHAAIDPHLADKRDSLMIDLLFNITVIVLPSAVLQFNLPAFLQPWATATGCLHLFIVYFFFIQRFILCLHYSEHKRLFKPSSPLTWFHSYTSFVLCPFFGIPSGVYRLHHVVMHHLEDNMFPEDLSSTMPYQRDKFTHFLHYWAKFFFAVHFELPYYAFRKQRYEMFATAIVCHCFWTGSTYFLHQINSTATFYTAMLPFVLTSFALMFGNWSQHIFVDPLKQGTPKSDYVLTYNCINHIENLYTFNDGYHIIHHINSRLHWSDMPQRFLDDIMNHASEDSINFVGLHFMQVGLYTMSGQLEKLAKHYVQLSDKPKSQAEIVTMFKERLVPCDMANVARDRAIDKAANKKAS